MSQVANPETNNIMAGNDAPTVDEFGNVNLMDETSDAEKTRALMDVEANAKFWENMQRISLILTILASIFALYYYFKTLK